MNEKKTDKKYEAEIDFKTLLKTPKRLFGWVFPYFFFILFLLGVFYVNTLTEISLNNVPVNPPVEDNIKRTLEMKKGIELPPVDLEVIQNPSDELINKGAELYEQNCVSCHGSEGLGDGPAGAALNPPPRDFTATDGWTNGRKFIGMYKTLQEGILENGMAAYEYLLPIDRIAIIHYTRTFADFPEITGDEVQELNSEYSLTEGVKSSNQIPVDLAKQKMLEERHSTQKIFNAIDYVNNHPALEGADIFNKVVRNKYRVLSAFYGSNIDAIEFTNFVEISSINFNELGFSAEISRLEQNEWQSLFNYLKNVLGTVNT